MIKKRFRYKQYVIRTYIKSDGLILFQAVDLFGKIVHSWKDIFSVDNLLNTDFLFEYFKSQLHV